MTMEKDSFEGLMSSLNLDDKFVTYQIHSDLNFSQLSIIKKNIEDQLSQLFDILSHQFNASMDTPLVAPDGFPRSDIDVVSIRLVRVKIIRLRNDHKQLLSLLESKLVQQFQNPSVQTHEKVQTTVPFARVDEVIPESPAHIAGLQLGDRIVLFDNDIHAGNHNKLGSVVSRVQSKVDSSIAVEVLRNTAPDSTPVVVELTPTNNWQGRGLLGCKIVPI